MPLDKREQEINKARIQIDLAKAFLRLLPIPADSKYALDHKTGMRHLRTASFLLDNILKEGEEK